MRWFLALLLVAMPLSGQIASRDFDGSNDDITLGQVLDTETTMTLAAWAKGGASGEAVITRGNTSDYTYAMRFTSFASQDDSMDCIAYQINGSAYLQAIDGSPGDTAELSNWHFYACTIDGSAPAARIYIDGTLAASDTTSSGSWNSSGDANAHIGGRQDNSSGRFWTGQIAHAHFYNRVLSAGEISALMYCPGSITGGLQAYLPLVDSSTQYDLAGLGNNGTNSGTTASTDGPPVSFCTGVSQ